MGDEFEVALDDGSEVVVAAAIMKIREETHDGFFGTVDRWWEQYQARKNPGVKAVRVGPSSDSEDSVDEEDDDDDEGEEDVEMMDAPVASKPKERIAPEIDEDGFTKVMGKRKNGR
jgi:pre-rRNA-processing protein TSR2